MCFVFAIWVGRRLESEFILHGRLVGVVAMLLYVAVTRIQPEPIELSHQHRPQPPALLHFLGREPYSPTGRSVTAAGS
jgi:hypothetical protein